MTQRESITRKIDELQRSIEHGRAEISRLEQELRTTPAAILEMDYSSDAAFVEHLRNEGRLPQKG